MTQELKKQKIYFVSLGLLGLVLISSLILLSINTKDQTSLQGSTAEGQLPKCSLEDCSDEELALRVTALKNAIAKRSKVTLTHNLSDKTQITAKPEVFLKQLNTLEAELTKLDKSSDKETEKKYNSYLVSLINRFNSARTAAIKKLRVVDFEQNKKQSIEQFINLNANLNQIKEFLQDHRNDLNMHHPTEEQIDAHMYNTNIDQELLASLLLENKSKALAKKAKEEQEKNKNNLTAQVKSNYDISQSIFLHSQAESYIHSLNIHKQKGAFSATSDQWMIDQIAQAEEYIVADKQVDNKYTHPSDTNNKNKQKYTRPSYENGYNSSGYFNFSLNVGRSSNGPTALQGYGGFFLPPPSHRKNKNFSRYGKNSRESSWLENQNYQRKDDKQSPPPKNNSGSRESHR